MLKNPMRSIIRKIQRSKNISDSNTLQAINAIFTVRRGYAFRMPKAGTPVILLVSGGLDSICLWNVLLSKYQLKVFPLRIRNAAHPMPGENKSIRFFSNYFSAQYPHLSKKVITRYFKPPMMLKNKFFWPAGENLSNFINNVSHVNNLGLIYRVDNPVVMSYFFYFASIALALSLSLKSSRNVEIFDMYSAITPEECRFVDSSLLTIRLINLLLCSMVDNYEYQFTALPLEISDQKTLLYTKKNLVQYAAQTQLPLEHSWSCVYERKVQCGKCLNCTNRRNAFKDAHIIDKTDYRYNLRSRKE